MNDTKYSFVPDGAYDFMMNHIDRQICEIERDNKHMFGLRSSLETKLRLMSFSHSGSSNVMDKFKIRGYSVSIDDTLEYGVLGCWEYTIL